MAPIATMIVRLGAQISEFQSEFKEATKSAQKFASEFEGIATRASAVGSFIGNVAADIAKSIAAGLGQAVRDSVRLSSEFANSLIGLSSVARAFGTDADVAKDAAKRLSADGLLPLKDSATGLKNLLAAGFNLEQSTQLMNAFKDSAAFGRQGALSFGDAVRSATEGVKNGNSILVDNAGVTKNLSQILKEAGFSAQDLSRASSDVAVRMALFNGILKETRAQTGDAQKLTETYTGQVSRLGTAYDNLLATYGAAITQNKTVATAIGAVSDAFVRLNDQLLNNRQAFTLISDGIIIFVKSLAFVLNALDLVQTGFTALQQTSNRLFEAFSNIGIAAFKIIEKMADLQKVLDPINFVRNAVAAEQARRAYTFLEGASKGLRDASAEAEARSISWGNTLQGLRGNLDGLAKQLETTRGKTVELGASENPLSAVSDGAAKAEGSLKEFTKSLSKLTADIDLANRNGARLATLVELFGDAASKAAEKAKAWGVNVKLSVNEVANAFKEVKTAAFLADFFADQGRAMRRHWEDVVKAVEKGADRMNKAFLENLDIGVLARKSLASVTDKIEGDSLKKRLAAIAEDAQKRRDLLNKNAGYYQESLNLINALERRSAELATHEWQQHVSDTAKSLNTFTNIFRTALEGIPDLIRQAFTGGGGLTGGIKSITSGLGAALGGKVFGELAAKLNNSLVSAFGVGVTSALGTIIPGIGAALGSLLTPDFFSKLGKKLSSGLSNIADLVGLGWEKDGRRMVERFADSLGGFDVLGKRLQELGTEGARLWRKLTQEVGSDNTTQATDAIQEVTAALNAFGTEAERAERRLNALGNAVAGVNRRAEIFAAPFRSALTELDKVTAQFDKEELKLAKLLLKKPPKNDAEAALFGLDLRSQLFDQFKVTREAEASIDSLVAKLAEIRARAQPEFERLGIFVGATFAAMVKESGDVLGSLKALTPAFTVLRDGVNEFGLETSGVIDQLLGVFALVNDATLGPIFEAIQATGQIFAGLQEAGFLTSNLFQTIATDIGASFRELEAKGGDVSKAMALSQPVLQRLWEAQQIYGEITDETTRKLIDQAFEQGIVGDHMKDVNQKILDVLIAIADVFGATLPESFRKTSKAATDTAREIENEFKDLDIPPVKIRVEYEDPGFAPIGDGVTLPRLAHGGIVRSPTLALIGESGPEAVLPLSGGHSPMIGSSTIIFEQDGRKAAEFIVPHIPGVVRRYGLV